MAKATAAEQEVPLYRYVGGSFAHILPVPMMNIVNGGQHADNPIDIQEFMIQPVGAPTVADAIRWGSEIFAQLKKALSAAGLNTNVGDEGGFAPALKSADEALALLPAPWKPQLPPRAGRNLCTGLRQHGILQKRPVRHGRRRQELDSAGMAAYLEDLVNRYPIVSIEDGMAEDDWEGWHC